jgi:hypothetical protein
MSPDEPDVVPYSLSDEVRYDSVAPWPREIGGSNKSINRISAAAFGNDGRHWQAQSESPGRVNFQTPTRGDFNADRMLNAHDVDLVCQAVRAANNDRKFDLTGDLRVDRSDFDVMMGEILATGPGDANLDRVFDSSDLVLAFIAAEYEDDISGNSTWTDGDWNCDGDFTTRDLVDAFIADDYQMPPAVNSIPDISPAAAQAAEVRAGQDVEVAGTWFNRSSDENGQQQRRAHNLAPTDQRFSLARWRNKRIDTVQSQQTNELEAIDGTNARPLIR